MNGPVQVMYSLKPLINFSEDIHLPTNMYKIKNIYGRYDDTKSGKQHEKKETSAQLDDIEVRQSLILKQLKELQSQMDVLRKQLNQSQTSIKTSKQDCSKSTVSSSNRIIDFKASGLINDAVIFADPKYPPYSLLGINKLWSGFLNVNITTYVHSSVADVPTKLLSQFSLQDQPSSNLPSLSITLVWKSIGPDCEFIISPLTHCPIQGEVNVLRFFHRNVNSTTDAVEETLLDGFLDSCYILNHVSTKNEQTSVLRKLNAVLGKSEWFGGDLWSIKDLAVWSSVRNVDNSDVTQNMLKWLERCNQQIGVSTA